MAAVVVRGCSAYRFVFSLLCDGRPIVCFVLVAGLWTTVLVVVYVQ